MISVYSMFSQKGCRWTDEPLSLTSWHTYAWTCCDHGWSRMSSPRFVKLGRDCTSMAICREYHHTETRWDAIGEQSQPQGFLRLEVNGSTKLTPGRLSKIWELDDNVNSWVTLSKLSQKPKRQDIRYSWSTLTNPTTLRLIPSVSMYMSLYSLVYPSWIS